MFDWSKHDFFKMTSEEWINLTSDLTRYTYQQEEILNIVNNYLENTLVDSKNLSIVKLQSNLIKKSCIEELINIGKVLVMLERLEKASNELEPK